MNKVLLFGRLTKDPEVRYTPSQLAVATFTLAIDRGKDKDGKDKGADFPRVTVFGRQAENCERFLKKGSQTIIEGRLQTGSYEDKNGNKVFTTDVMADRVQFIFTDKKEESKEEQREEAPSGFTAIEEDIPF